MLVEMIKKDAVAKACIAYFARRQRYRKEPMRLSRLKKAMRYDGLVVKLTDLYKLFRKLEEQGYGHLVYSRKRPTYFVWAVNYIEMANEAVKPVRPIGSLSFKLPNGRRVVVETQGKINKKDLTHLVNNIKSMMA